MTQRKYQGKSIPVRVYTTRGLKDQARFALECAHRTVDYFSEVFEIEYPLPKADLLAVHEFVRHMTPVRRADRTHPLAGHGCDGELGPGHLPDNRGSVR